MTKALASRLEHRALLELCGPEARSFLQGLVTNDVNAVTAERALWSALLTPQGKFLHEFFISAPEGAEPTLHLEAEAERLEDLAKRLSRYRLRSRVEIGPVPDRAVFALHGASALEHAALPAVPGAARLWLGGLAFVDPRLAALGARAHLPRETAETRLEEAGFASAPQADYDRLRIGLGIPDGSRDMEVEKAILLENGFDELGAIAWNKGCFMGQELTARTRYRGLIKKRLLPLAFAGAPPAPGDAVTQGERSVGTVKSVAGGRALVLLRLEALDESAGGLRAGATRLRPEKPDWALF